MIKVTNLSHYYNKDLALKDINLEIKKAQFDSIIVEYALNSSSPIWLPLNTFTIGTNFELFESDLSSIIGANNNPNLVVRLRFDGTNMTVDNGNRVTFNNISVEGVEESLSIENPLSQNLSVYPNPFEDLIYLSDANQIFTYNLYSIEGKMIKSGEIKDGKLNLQQLSKGIYLLQLQNNEFTKTIKLVKK